MSVASAVSASISTGPSGRAGCSETTMRAGASSSVMSWPLRSLNRTVFWPTGSSSWSRVMGAVGGPGAVPPYVERDAYVAAPEAGCQTHVRSDVVRVGLLDNVFYQGRPETYPVAGGLLVPAG